MNEPKMRLMPSPPGTCPICATKHDPDMPHNQQSLYYQMRFQIENGRWPTWGDAMAHCTDEVKRTWTSALAEHGITVKEENK